MYVYLGSGLRRVVYEEEWNGLAWHVEECETGEVGRLAFGMYCVTILY